MKYKITLNGKTYEVEVEEGQAMLVDEYEAYKPAAPAAAPAPAPLSIALLMLSFGSPAAFAFSIAVLNRKLPAGSGPPSLAATINSLEYFWNTTAF